MSAYANYSFPVIAEAEAAISLSKEQKKSVNVNIGGINILVSPNSDRLTIVGHWEEEYGKRKK